MISVFLLLFFGGMILLALPVVGCIVLSASSIPLLGGSISFSGFAECSISGGVANNVGLTIVLFMIAGEFMARGKLTEKIFDTFAYFLGKKRAFMPILSICTCMFYGAISGSGPATTAAVGAMCYPMLVEMGYPKAEVERDLLNRMFPELPAEITEKMVDFANDVRRNFMGNSSAHDALDVTLSTRTLIRWARLTIAFQPLSKQGISPTMYALDCALGFRASTTSRAALHEMAQRIFPSISN